jgi:hypothetical protein
MNCPVKKDCFAQTERASYLCKTCKDQSNFDPMNPPYSIDELISAGIASGVTEFHLFNINRDFDMPGVEWHWDVYDKDPHVWFHIPKIWTLRLWWRGWRKGKLPFDVYYDRWVFTYYKNDTVQGCQCTGGDDIDPRRGLMYAMSHYHCAKRSGCEGDCDTCPDSDWYYRR